MYVLYCMYVCLCREEVLLVVVVVTCRVYEREAIAHCPNTRNNRRRKNQSENPTQGINSSPAYNHQLPSKKESQENNTNDHAVV